MSRQRTSNAVRTHARFLGAWMVKMSLAQYNLRTSSLRLRFGTDPCMSLRDQLCNPAFERTSVPRIYISLCAG
jgi:hypothetical protein